jgi:hypothetical protein
MIGNSPQKTPVAKTVRKQEMSDYVADRTTFAALLSSGDKHAPPASADEDHDSTLRRRPPIAAPALKAPSQLHSAIEQKKK